MDSSNPHTYPPFMDLLTSQQESNNSAWLPHFTPSLQPSSSQVPLHSSQHSVSVGSDGRRLWSTTEDLVLISAWLNTSKDSAVGNGQKADAFWKRITELFNSCPDVAGQPERKLLQCKQRWGRINEFVGKFAGCYANAKSQKASGKSDDDIIKDAYEIYESDHKSKFTLEYAWRVLRNEQKWCNLTNTEDEAGAFSSAGNHVDEQVETRPPGVKAAKGKGKKSGSKRTAEEMEENSRTTVESMWAVKEKDMAIRERLSKMKILDTLIAKTEPLSEIELSLKNKLMTDMLQG